MRRWPRPFTVFPAASLLLCATIGALWAAAGHARFVHAGRRTATRGEDRFVEHHVAIGCSDGRLMVTWADRFWPHESIPASVSEKALVPETGCYLKVDPKVQLAPPRPPKPARNDQSRDCEFAGVRVEQILRLPDLGSAGTNGVRVTMPPAYPLALSAVLPSIALVRARRRHHLIQTGCCLTCGYDLRATPGRCPECGAVPEGTMRQE